MKITVIYPMLPPRLDGIGDYTAYLCAEMARQGHTVSLLTATENAAPVQNVPVQKVFTQGDAASVLNIVAPILADPPDWVLLQYNPFSYGKYGWCPQTISAVKQLRKGLPKHSRIAVMAHETFVPAESPKFVVMTLWQRALFFQLGHECDLLFLSVEVWAKRFQKWFPRIPVRHGYVGASLPLSALSKSEARRKSQVDENAFVVGLFGTAHPSRMLHTVGSALRVLKNNNAKTVLLYVGPHGDAVRAAVGDAAPLYDAGPLPPGDVADRFRAMDMCLSPYLDGISTRRSAFMPGLQHGIPSVATVGIHTDSILKQAEGTAFFAPPVTDSAAFEECAIRLQNDESLRNAMGQAGQKLYNTEFDWPVIARRMIGEMEVAAGVREKTHPKSGETGQKAV